MRKFTPSYPYATPIELLIPTYSTQKGAQVKIFPQNGIQIFCSFKTYMGSESSVNGVYAVIDTAHVETWYRPDVKADCRIKLLQTGDVYEIVGKPENVEMRNQFLKFRVQAVEGRA